MNILLGALKYAGVNKEFFVLVSIFLIILGCLFFIAKAYFLIVKAYTAFEVKQEQCEGRFNLQDYKIGTIEKGVKESKTNSKEALDAVKEIKTCTGKMQKTVEEIKEGFEDLVEGKYGNAETR